MKSFIKEFLTNLLIGLISVLAILIWFGVIILIVIYIPEGILSVVLTLLYAIISAALGMTIFCRADKEIVNKIRGYK